MAHPIITLTTDFGLSDHFVGAVKGVILNIVPDAEIVDISHAVEAFDVLDGALTIAQAYSYFPAGTIHLVVVDPGVGTARRPIIATSERHRFVAPDNGVLSLIYGGEERFTVFHATSEHYFLQEVSRTFHARDVFAPIAAYLAKGVAPSNFGNQISDFLRIDLPKPAPVNEHTLRGKVIKVDSFGNLITNIGMQDAPFLFQLEPPAFRILLGEHEIRVMKKAYGESAPGVAFGILGSMGYLEIAINQGSAFRTLGVARGTDVDLVLETAATPGKG